VPGKQSKGSVRVRVTTTAEFLTICLAGHQTDVYVSPFLRSSSQCAWQVTERNFTYHHPCRVPHNVPGRPPKGRVRITTLTEFLTMCLADHRKEVLVSPALQSSSQYTWQATKRTCTYHHSHGVPHSTTGRPPNESVQHHLRGSSQSAWYATKRKRTCRHFWRSPHRVRGRPSNASYAVSVSQQESVCPLLTARGDLLEARRGGDPDGILFRMR